jgi:hypothetical protein
LSRLYSMIPKSGYRPSAKDHHARIS